MALPFQVAVHYRKKHLHEEIDGVQEDGEQEEPCFARHDGGIHLHTASSDLERLLCVLSSNLYLVSCCLVISGLVITMFIGRNLNLF